MPGRGARGKFAGVELGRDLEGDQFVREGASPRLNLKILVRQAVHLIPCAGLGAPNPESLGTGRSAVMNPAAFLTECSVYVSIGCVPMPVPGDSGTADAVVVGGGTVGAWCACFLRRSGLRRVVLLEKGMLGQGASSRAAGIVRTQGGTPWAVRLGQWSRRFYLGQRDEFGIDSGFVQQGYLLPCFTAAEVAAARQRLAMQTALGLPVRWLDPAQVDELNPTPGARADSWRHLLRGGRLPHAAAQRDRVRGDTGNVLVSTYVNAWPSAGW